MRWQNANGPAGIAPQPVTLRGVAVRYAPAITIGRTACRTAGASGADSRTSARSTGAVACTAPFAASGQNTGSIPSSTCDWIAQQML